MSGNRSPLPWTGNKACISDSLLAFMPQHDRYIEPFCGSAEFLLTKPRSKEEYINDYNGDIANFFRVIQNNDALVEFIGKMLVAPNSEQLFAERKIRLLESFIPTEIVTPEDRILEVSNEEVTRAVEFFLNQFYSFSSTGGSFGIANRSPINKLGKILYASNRLQGVCILNRDYKKVILEQSKINTFIFADPPYFTTTDMYQHSNFEESETAVLFETLGKVDEKFFGSCKFLMTNTNHPFVTELANKYGWNMRVIQRLHNMVQSRKPGAQFEELLIANYDLEAQAISNNRYVFENGKQLTIYDFINSQED